MSFYQSAILIFQLIRFPGLQSRLNPNEKSSSVKILLNFLAQNTSEKERAPELVPDFKPNLDY